MNELLKAVIDVLRACEIVGLKGASDYGDKKEVAETYCLVLDADHITPEAVKRAKVPLLRSQFFPKPGEFRDACMVAMGELASERERAFWSSLVNCRDENGTACVAPPCKVRNGLLLPEGDESGDGSPAPLKAPTDRGRLILSDLLEGNPTVTRKLESCEGENV